MVFSYTIKPCIYGSIACWLNNTKSISVITGLGYVFIKNNLLTLIVKLLYKFALKHNYQVWFLNKDDKEEFLKQKIINNNYKIHILNGEGINTEYFKPSKGNKKNDSNIKFILIDRMLWDKGIGEYVEAARILKQTYPYTKFYLLGPIDVDNPSAIPKSQIDKWGLKGVVEYLGVRNNVKEILKNVDCVVLPSY